VLVIAVKLEAKQKYHMGAMLFFLYKKNDLKKYIAFRKKKLTTI
jgi:hypothetical protein